MPLLALANYPPDVIDIRTNRPLQIVDTAWEYVYNAGADRDDSVTVNGTWSFYLDSCWRERWFRTGDSDVAIEAGKLVADARPIPKRIADERDYCKRFLSAPPAPGDFARPAVPGKKFDFVLEPQKKYDGWYQRGRCHLIAGSSGVGKTRFMLDMLDQQAKGQYFLGYRGKGLDFMVIFADRGKLANEEVLETMGLDHIADKLAYIPVLWGRDAADAIKAKIEAADTLPQVVFVEAADTLVDKPSAAESVAPFLSRMNAIAEHYHIAVILSLGAGKHKEGEGYKNSRDHAFGSVMWQRLTDLSVTMYFDGDADGDDREIKVKFRSAKPVKFTMRFDSDGRLKEYTKQSSEVHAVDAWFAANPNEAVTRAEVTSALKDADAALSKTAVYDRIMVLLNTGKLVKGMNAEGKHTVKFPKGNHDA